MLLTVMMQNVVGMSVVGSDYDKLKRYNLAELYNPVSKAQES
jgi:tRNA acetyltransferase TAN1